MTAVSISGISLESDMAGGLSAPWSTVATGANNFGNFNGGGLLLDGTQANLENKGDSGSVSEGRYDLNDVAATFDGDASDPELLIAIHQRTRAPQQRAGAGDVNVNGIKFRLHSTIPGGTPDDITDGMDYAITGSDVLPVNDNYELCIIDCTTTAAGSTYRQETGTFVNSSIDEISLICEQTADNVLEMWSHLLIITPVILIGGDGGDTDGTFQDFFDYAGIYRTFARATPKTVFTRVIMQFGNGGTNGTVFADEGFAFEFANEANTGKAIAGAPKPGYHHIQDNTLGLKADMGADDDITLTNCTFNSLTKYKYIIAGSTNDTYKVVGGRIKFVGDFQVSPAATFDGVTVEGNETMVFT